jgi:hypothetical protein
VSGSTRWLLLAAVVVVLVIAAGVGASVTGGGARTYPEGSPERAVQQYLQAVAENDAARATEFLSADLAKRCVDYPRDAISNRGRQSVRATLEETTLRNGTASVRVTLIESYGSDPFGGGESTFSTVFDLRQEGGAWRFSQSPWPLYCPAVAPAIPPPIR